MVVFLITNKSPGLFLFAGLKLRVGRAKLGTPARIERESD